MARLTDDPESISVYTTKHSPSGDQQIFFVPDMKDETEHCQNNMKRKSSQGYETIFTRRYSIADSSIVTILPSVQSNVINALSQVVIQKLSTVDQTSSDTNERYILKTRMEKLLTFFHVPCIHVSEISAAFHGGPTSWIIFVGSTVPSLYQLNRLQSQRHQA